jgi:predicted amidohydrolase
MKLTIGCAQLTSGDDQAANLAAAERAIRELAERGARLIMLPEHFSFIGPDHLRQKVAEPLSSAFWLPRIRDLCRQLDVFVHIGSFLERHDGRVHNTGVVVAPDGEIKAVYRKIHLFDVEIPGGMTYRESAVITAGSQVVTVTIDDFVFGMATCYDLRFPELFRRLTAQGATVLLVPAAFTLQTGRDHWEVLLRARAIENLCWVAAAGQWGAAPPQHLLFGRSMIINPWGLVVAQAPDGPAVITAELDLQALRDIRTRFPALNHRRPDLFPDG